MNVYSQVEDSVYVCVCLEKKEKKTIYVCIYVCVHIHIVWEAEDQYKPDN